MSTNSGADLSWTPIGSGNKGLIEYVPIDFSLGSGTVVNVIPNNSYTLTGLNSGLLTISGAADCIFVRRTC